MNLDKYSDRVKGFVQSAQSLALSSNHQQFSALHILKVLLDDPEGLAASLMERAGARPKDAALAVGVELGKMPAVSGGDGQLYLSPGLAKVFATAEKAAEKAGDSYVTVERLLLALTIEKSAQTGEILSKCGLTPQSLNTTIEEIRKGKTADSANAEAGETAG